MPVELTALIVVDERCSPVLQYVRWYWRTMHIKGDSDETTALLDLRGDFRRAVVSSAHGFRTMSA
jgi:hypothetical protein